jgi:hypothetical protein
VRVRIALRVRSTTLGLVAHLVERRSRTAEVAGSTPAGSTPKEAAGRGRPHPRVKAGRSTPGRRACGKGPGSNPDHALLAHSGERRPVKPEVAGSKPVLGARGGFAAGKASGLLTRRASRAGSTPVRGAHRDVAQLGRARGWGPRGRRFNSGRPDQRALAQLGQRAAFGTRRPPVRVRPARPWRGHPTGDGRSPENC